MPNRIISEKIRTSKTINKLNDFQFRLWAYLLTYVDDYGRGSADTELLKGFVFPRRAGVREQDIQKGLEVLERNGSILLYEFAGEPYFCFPTWAKYQRIQTKVSKFPEPSENDMKRWETIAYGESPLSTVSHRESPLESNPNPNPNPNPEGDNARFTPPTPGMVAEYAASASLTLDEQRFCDFYASKGWKVGSATMKDWKAAVRNWCARDRQDRGTTAPAQHRAPKMVREQQYSQREYAESEGLPAWMLDKLKEQQEAQM